MDKTKFSMKRKIYYHDTDAGGVVYYGRYLEFFEDARTEFFYSEGIDLGRMIKEGTFFVVAHIETSYKKPARYLDEISVSAEVEKFTASSIHFRQDVRKGEILIAEAKIVIVCVGKDFKPKRIPCPIKKILPNET